MLLKHNNIHFRARTLFAAIAVFMLSGFTSLSGGQKDDVYPLDTCIVSGEKLGSRGDSVLYDHEGREVLFCCKKCIKKFEREPSRYLKKLDEKIVQLQLPHYPLETCVVSGEELGGEMGEPVNWVYRNRLVRLCCKGCKKDFLKAEEKFFAELDKAVIEKQKPSYPLDTCVVSGEKLGGEMGPPVDYVAGNRLVRFCCKGCVKDFRKEPSKYMKKIDAALKLPGKDTEESSSKTKTDEGREKKHHDHGDHGHDHSDGKQK